MTKLTYHPAYDPHHSLFRMFRVLLIAPPELRDEALQIADFYLVFPHTISAGQWPQGTAKSARQAASSAKPYAQLPPPHILFRNTRPIYSAALETLLSAKHISRPEGQPLTLLPKLDELPNELVTRAQKRNERDHDLVHFLRNVVLTLPVDGPRGLKARSGLMEYRYDPV